MATHSVSIAAAAASLGATQLKQPEKVTPRWPRRLRQKIARNAIRRRLAPPLPHDKRGLILAEGTRDQPQWALRARFSRLRRRRSSQHGHGSARRLRCRRPRWPRVRSFIASRTRRFGGPRAPSGRRFRSTPGKSMRIWPSSSTSRTACAPTPSITDWTRLPKSPSVTASRCCKGCGCRTCPSAAASRSRPQSRWPSGFPT